MAGSKRLGLLPTAGGGIVAAIVLVVIVYFVAKGVGDGLLVAPEVGTSTPEELKLGVTIAAVIFGGVLGAVLTVLARRFTPRPQMFFLGVSVLGLTLYGILAFVRSEETSTAIWLNAMHIAAAVPIVGGLMFLLPPRTSRMKRLLESRPPSHSKDNPLVSAGSRAKPRSEN